MKIWLFAPFVFAALVAGCNSSPSTESGTDQTSSTTGADPAKKALTVGIVFDSGGRGDKSFNDSAWNGLQRAEKELGVTPKSVDSKSEKDYEPNLEALAESGCDLVVAVGINMKNSLEVVAPKYPKVKFAIVDASVKADNVRSLLFKEEEGSFLAGYLAGLMTKTNTLGFVGGMSIDLIKKFECGFEAGARMANSKVTMLPAKYTGDWNNVDLAKTAANVLFDGNADIVYHAAGRAGLGVLTAASEKNKFAIGVDSDQDDIQKGHVLTSMIKHVDEAVFSSIKDLKDGQFVPGDKIYNLKDGGVGLSGMRFTKDLIGAENLQKIESVKARISSGEIVVPATTDELTKFVANMPK